MNDALRKKKIEKKHLSGTDIFSDDSGREPKNRIRIYGIAAIVLLVCAIAGYYFYEMMSLSRPMTPDRQSPLMAEPRVSPPEKTVSPDQDTGVPVPSDTAPHIDRQPEKQATLSGAAVPDQTSPVLAPEKHKATPAPAPLRTVLQPLHEKAEESASSKTSLPPPVIEPEEVSLPPESAGDTIADQTEKAVTPIDPGTVPVEELFYRKGLSYHRQNKLEMAIQMYQTVLKKNPDHRSTRFNLASAYIQVAAYSQARTILLDLNRQEPENPQILLNLAVVEIGLDRPEEALAFLESAEKKVAAPTFEILFHKGAAYSRMGDFETALDMYRKAERLAPENPRLWLNTAIVYDSLAQYNQAIGYYQISLDRNPSLTTTEKREIETRLRELKAYLAQGTVRSATKPQTESGQVE